MKHCYEEFDRPLQELMMLMEDDYPNNFEIVITPIGAEIRSTLSTMHFLNKRYREEQAISKEFQGIVKNFYDTINDTLKDQKEKEKGEENNEANFTYAD